MTEEDEFWNQPLAIWLKDLATGEAALVTDAQWRLNTAKNSPIRYRELTDGVLLSLIFHEIEPIGEASIVVTDPSASRDTNWKQRLFFWLLEAIRRFYKHHLNQLVILSPPDIPSIVRSLRPEESGDELNKFLLLLLGCAVQGERRKTFVNRITRLAPHTQNALAKHIQKITEESSVVVSVPYHTPEESSLVSHLEQVVRDRDALALQIHHMSTDPESDEGSSTTATSSLNGDPAPVRFTELKYDHRTPSPTNFDKLHSHVEMAGRKQEFRSLQNRCQDLEMEIQDREFELQQKEELINKMQEERHSLVKDAAAARDLRDELDCLQLKVDKLEKLEHQNKRLQEQLADKEYWASRAKDLMGENDNLRKAMDLVEEQLQVQQNKFKDGPDVDTRVEEFQAAIRKLQGEISEKNLQIESLLVEQSRLESDLFLRNEKLTELERTAIACDGLTPRENYGSLADQLEDSHRAETARLLLEVKQLRAKLENKDDASEVSFSILMPELEDLKKEVHEKDKQLVQMKDENDIVTKQLNQLEQTLSALNAEFKETTEELSMVRSARDEAVHSLHDARRKFTQFQTEFGMKFELEAEKKVRECGIELEQAKVRLQSTEDERSLLEKQLDKLREEQRQTRNDLDDVKEAKHQLELQLSRTERSLKSAENERTAIRERADQAEDELEALRMRILTTDDAVKRLENSEKLLVEQSNRLGDLESENRTLHQHVDLESKKTQRLREDLVTEKTRNGELIGRIRSLCAAINLNGGKIDADIDDTKLIDTIDDVIMTALHAAKREADAARLQQHKQLAELADLRKDIEKLRRSESASLVESDDKVRELGKENINMKEQIFVLQEKIRELQIEVSTKSSEIVVAKREIEELNRNTTAATVSNTELARLQVSLRNLQLQEELLKQDNTELRNQLDLAEKSRHSAKKDADSLAAMHQALLADHDRLQNLHDLLTQDYEHAKQENQDMKLKLRTHRPSPVAIPMREIEELRTTLAQERLAREKQMRTYADLQNEHGALKREMDTIRKENDYLSKNCEGMSAELRSLKLTEQAQRATIRDLTATVDELTKSLQAKELELAKLQHRVEMLTQLNRTLDEENKNLSRQLEMLMSQNKELWSRALTDKDQHLQEQKDFQDKLSALRRHKEKLEEKIMEQYRSMENKRCPGTKQNTLVKRAAKVLIPRRRPSQPPSNGASSTEDSSTYSADESPAINGHEELDLFPPTCSSSEDQDRVSPRYETIINFKNPEEPGEFRRRNDLIGGSVRIYSSSHRPYMMEPKPYEERSVDVPSYLPPRAPVRNSSVTASLRIARPPPPPYKTAPKQQPIYAQPNVPNSLSSPSPVPMFIPNACSTPKSDSSSMNGDRPVVAEGERRVYIREKEERVDKAMSIYENVPAESNKPNESTVWYEYGCV